MLYDVIMSGFGGQGVLLIGDLLAYVAMQEGKQVTWMPSYGVEMRGGAANCTVVISDKKVGAPLSEAPAALVAMSNPGLLKFQDRLQPGGLLVVNSSLADLQQVERSDVDLLGIPANEIAAREMGDQKNANMIVLGAFIAKSKAVSFTETLDSLSGFLPSGRQQLAGAIAEALERGKLYVEEGC
ncbi:MAG: 2-oxoacid:acceptor oxidoreductase family protein [Dethiobacter sp.]|jgi:2-oxoglutarate ferredoxin oxidoreductase subunit gamma|nr:2-oxoacid:acceptor oxidoreductase family protein [Dethiobacter sp.]